MTFSRMVSLKDLHIYFLKMFLVQVLRESWSETVSWEVFSPFHFSGRVCGELPFFLPERFGGIEQ